MSPEPLPQLCLCSLLHSLLLFTHKFCLFFQGPPGDVVQPLPITIPKKSKRSIDGSKMLPQNEEASPADATGTGFMTGNEDMEEILGSLNSLHAEIESMRFPLGTKESPARTCHDLHLSQSEYKDGMVITFLCTQLGNSDSISRHFVAPPPAERNTVFFFSGQVNTGLIQTRAVLVTPLRFTATLQQVEKHASILARKWRM